LFNLKKCVLNLDFINNEGRNLRLLIFSVVFFSGHFLFGQGRITIELKEVDGLSLPSKIKYKKTADDYDSATEEMRQLLKKLYQLGYIEASVDSIQTDSTSFYRAHLSLGRQYSVSALQSGNLSKEIIAKTGFRESKYEDEPFSFDEIQNQISKIVRYYENHGYPFAEVWLDSFQFDGSQIFSKVYAQPNEFIIIDSIVIHGSTNTKSRFLQNYLQISPGDPYDQSKITSIDRKLRQLPYLRLQKEVEVIFTPGYASIHLYLEKQRSNQFNFIIGVLPNNQLTDRKLTITGDGRLHLQNSFGVGEEIFAEFRQIRPLTQNLDLDFVYPYIANLPVGVGGSFNLYKNDTLFVNIDSEIGFMYQFGGMNYFRAFYHNQVSNVLNYDTASIRMSRELPQTIDVRNNRYGVGIFMQNLDYVLNPRAGYMIKTALSTGNKVIKKNPVVAALKDEDGREMEYLYEKFDLKSLAHGISLHIQYFLPVKSRSTVLFSNRSEAIVAKNIFINEKYRIGGSNILRGFDEESIFTPFYSLSTIEYRFLLSRNSYFNTFVDVAVVEDVRFGAGNIDVPFGFGTGVALETKGGIFSLAYALGKQLDNKLDFRNGKIHFGFVSIF
jgi:outer membrane protein assembly factor BamA